jgi:hypothetical protein
MNTARARLAALVATAALPACQPVGPPEAWLGEIQPAEVAVGAGSRYPHLAPTNDGRVVMSWLQAQAPGGFALQHATWDQGRWGTPGTVTSGTDWFVNWADFPSVVPVTRSTWAAHWLRQKPGSVYSYDVRVAVSQDAGATWSAPSSPHDDGTPTEHGFVTMYAADGAARLVWLDGRHTAGGHDHGGGAGAMTLRGATIGTDGLRVGADVEIDERVCDCCQTDVAVTADGPLAVYRDRSDGEVRDIAVARLEGGSWSTPALVHADGWRIDACPVNGPAVAAAGRTVAVAWFTAPDTPRVRLAFSEDAGRTFAAPLEVASGEVVGRVDAVLLDDGRAIVSWMQQSPAGAEIRVQPFTREGAAGAAVVVASTSVHRSSGFPQMVRAGDGLLFAWTDAGDPPRIRTAFARLR